MRFDNLEGAVPMNLHPLPAETRYPLVSAGTAKERVVPGHDSGMPAHCRKPWPRFQKRGPSCRSLEAVVSGCCTGHEPQMSCRREDCSRPLPNRGLHWNVNGCPQGDLICKLKAKCRVFKDLLLVKRDLVDELTVCPRSLLVITWLHLEIQSDLMIWRTHFDWG